MADTLTENGREKSEKSTEVLSNPPLLLFDVFFLKLFLTVAFTFSYFTHNITLLKSSSSFHLQHIKKLLYVFSYSSPVFFFFLHFLFRFT